MSAGVFADLEQALRALTMEHLAKLAAYVPGPVKKQGTRKKLLAAYRQDPVFSIFGLDSLEYLGATLAGGTATSIHRKIGYAAHQKRPPFAQIKRPTTWKEKVVVVKDCAVWWWIALPEQKGCRPRGARNQAAFPGCFEVIAA